MKCKLCKEKEASKVLGFCAKCIKQRWKEVKAEVLEVHKRTRAEFGLPETIPSAADGIQCGLCANNCKIAPGQRGYCGLRENKDGKLVSLAGTPEKGLLRYYYDALPTNCVAGWCCGLSGKEWSAEAGLASFNLAVFYGACCFNCLFCQNWEFKLMTQALEPLVSAEQLAAAIRKDVACVCFFGGDPAPQLLHAIATAKAAKEKGKKVRWCLETNGMENPALLKQFALISLESGGTIKFDLKTRSKELSIALSGISNEAAYKNFRLIADLARQRKEPSLITASTLLVPYYIDAEEVAQIAQFIASIDENIPYTLLAFWPAYRMTDLPTTSWKEAEACFKAAKEAGLKRVRLGNVHLLR